MKTEIELAELIRDSNHSFDVTGTGTKRALGRPVEAEATLELSGFSGIKLYEPAELVLEAGAGTRLSEIEAEIDAQRQQLAFEPPDFSRLMGSAHSGSIGGTLACALAGPRRIKAGGARDHVLGLTCVTGRGDIVKAGARVVKNVTGYDMPKLLAGSHGTLAAMTSVTFKILPKPETEETLVLSGLDDAAALRAMSRAMQSPCEVSGAAHMPDKGTYLRLEGIPASVAARREKLKSLLQGEIAVLAAEQSKPLWSDIRDVAVFADNQIRVVWRISVAPTDGPKVVDKIREHTAFRHYYDWAGGLIWLDIPSTNDGMEDVIRGAITTGHATMFRAPADVRAHGHVFHPQAKDLAALTARVKASFDPQAKLNPGRMYKGV